jgi:ankyrin repeat protein
MEDLDLPTNQLRIALISRDVEGVKAAIKAGADINFRGGAPVSTVSWEGDDPVGREIMRILLEAGANPNKAVDGPSPPPLAIASVANSTVMVEMLLKAGANPNVSFGRYKSVLDYAVQVSVTPNNRNIKILCEATNYDEVERLKQKYPEYANMLNCQQSKEYISKNMGAVETAFDRAAAKIHPELQDGVELPHVMKNIKDYVGYKNVGPGGRRRKTKKRKSSKKKTKKRK